MGKIVKWSDEEIILLKKEYNKPYGVLVELFQGRTKRALKHKIGSLGLQRIERRRWTEEERRVLEQFREYTPKDFVQKGLLRRSEYQIAAQLREIRGSANRCLKKGWAVPSKELAYILGAWCSDGSCSQYVVEWTQKKEDVFFLENMKLLVENVFGLPVSDAFKKKELNQQRLWVCSREFAKKVFSVNGIVAKPDWAELITEKYSWICDDDVFFWEFIGGLYDGDGCLSIGFRKSMQDGLWSSVTMGIKPVISRDFFVSEMHKRGFVWKPSSSSKEGVVESVGLCGGVEKKKEFFEKVKCVLERKKKEGVGKRFERITREEANSFLHEYHYLGATLRPGTVSFGGIYNNVLRGVVCFGSPMSAYENQQLLGKEHASKVRELVRFATVDGVGKNFSSTLLAQGLRKIAEEGIWVVLSYADTKVGHRGTIYKATNAYYLGETKSKKKKFVYVVARGENKARAKEIFMARNRRRLVSQKDIVDNV